MKIERATERDSNFIEGLLHIWEASVRETHDFLKYSDIDAIRNKYSKLSRKQDTKNQQRSAHYALR